MVTKKTVTKCLLKKDIYIKNFWLERMKIMLLKYAENH